MTRPMGEMTGLQRVNEQAFAVRQLQRRPGPQTLFSYARVRRPTTQLISATSGDWIAWRDFSTNDPAVFATSTDGTTVSNTDSDTYLLLRQPGYYDCVAVTNWTGTGTWNNEMFIDFTSPGSRQAFSHSIVRASWATEILTPATNAPFWLIDHDGILCETTESVQVRVNNGSGFSKTVADTSLFVLYFPMVCDVDGVDSVY